MNHTTLYVGALIIGGSFIVGQYVVSDPVRNADRVITVQGTGTSKQTPNIAHVSFGVVISGQPSASQATDMMAKKMNAVLAAIKAAGIADGDITTQSLSVNPAFDYNNGTQVPRGFDANQQVDVTIRKTDTAGDIISKATAAGANQIGSVSFTSDDQSSAQLSAEQDAIRNANKKAQAIASELHVRLGKVKTYSVDSSPNLPMPYAADAKFGLGGGAPTAPNVPVGTQETTASVSITYEIR
ncbi:MAG TPA: SIMPL domain-containing protein [Candidatus Andersenbacteria bacterium]|nr:SIMPL domain-containing protein [Candidatus Andersenbacteria bacterium]